MAKSKDLAIYSTPKAIGSRIRVSGKKIKKTVKKTVKNLSSKTTAQQRFLGKTLPKAIFKVGKAAFMNPVYAIGLGVAPGVISALGKQKGISFAGTRQYNKKGRKIT